jgi:hypothetical protein
MNLFSDAARVFVLIIALMVGAASAAAQTAILYEESSSNTKGKRYEGTVSWSLENADSARPMEAAIRGKIIIPERQMKVTLTIRRDNDKGSSTSHLILTQFTQPAKFAHGGIQEVRAILMKETEEMRGSQLAGLVAKVKPGVFLVGLSARDRIGNIELLEQRGWFDIALVYDDQSRALLAVEKGTQGERVLKDAFAAWASDAVPAGGPGK